MMKGDLKAMYQRRADELAQERFGKDFYDLTEEQQYKIFGDAEIEIMEEQLENAKRWRQELEKNDLTITVVR